MLDFIGNQRREFRFDPRLRALLGGSRKQTKQQIETGITRLPGNCYFRLDKESRKAVLENLKAQLQVNRARMVAELKALAAQLGRRPTLIEYLAETRYELTEFSTSHRSEAGMRCFMRDNFWRKPPRRAAIC